MHYLQEALITEPEVTTSTPSTILPIDYGEFLRPGDNVKEDEFEARCIRYCKGTLIRRPIAYNSHGQKYRPLPNELSIDTCILNPYAHIKKEKEIYNCWRLKVPSWDFCNQPGLSRDFQGSKPEKTSEYVIKHVNDGKPFKCFEERTRNAHSLENCNAPFTIQGFPYCDPNSKYIGRKLVFTIQAFNHSNPTRPTIPMRRPALRNISKMTSGDPTKGSYERNAKLVQNFEIEFRGKKYTVWRMSGFTMRSRFSQDPTLRLNSIPLTGTLDDKLGRPYAYIHPGKMQPFKYRKGILSNFSYGYYDCFGNPLLEYDDCGNLPFATISKNSSGHNVEEPATKEAVTLPGGEMYNCYKSQIPSYKCGVPVDLVGEACRLWKTFFNMDISTIDSNDTITV